MPPRIVAATLAAAAVAAFAPTAAPARTPLQIGAVLPELVDASLAGQAVTLLRAAGLGDVARVTVTWQRGQATLDAGLLGDLRNGVAQASAAGVDVYLDVYPENSTQTPLSTADQAQFASWTAATVADLPWIRHVIVGNESNLNLFWMPQFGAGGRDTAATAYEHLLARTYDAVKALAPNVEVVGGALAHSGIDRPGTGRDTHSPETFVLDMGKAYRASGREQPIMDAFAYHPYMERSNLDPTFRHVRSKTLTIADYGKLVSVLKRAFDGTAQKGSALPIVYAEFGVESTIAPAESSLYTLAEPRTTHPVSPAVQAKYYTEGFHLAACQPTVRTIMVFRLIDEDLLTGWQSGLYYADRQTPKASLAPVALAATRYRARSIPGCAKLLAPKPAVTWHPRSAQITCDVDCTYQLRLAKVAGGTVAVRRGVATAGVRTNVVLPRLDRTDGRYRLRLHVTAVPYRANAFTSASRVFPAVR